MSCGLDGRRDKDGRGGAHGWDDVRYWRSPWALFGLLCPRGTEKLRSSEGPKGMLDFMSSSGEHSPFEQIVALPP